MNLNFINEVLDNLPTILVIWMGVSVVTSVLVGHMIHVGTRDPE